MAPASAQCPQPPDIPAVGCAHTYISIYIARSAVCLGHRRWFLLFLFHRAIQRLLCCSCALVCGSHSQLEGRGQLVMPMSWWPLFQLPRRTQSATAVPLGEQGELPSPSIAGLPFEHLGGISAWLFCPEHHSLTVGYPPLPCAGSSPCPQCGRLLRYRLKGTPCPSPVCCSCGA